MNELNINGVTAKKTIHGWEVYGKYSPPIALLPNIREVKKYMKSYQITELVKKWVK